MTALYPPRGLCVARSSWRRLFSAISARQCCFLRAAGSPRGETGIVLW